MLRMRRRIERLEEALAPLGDPGPPEVMNIHFVDSQKNIVDTMVIELPTGSPLQAPPLASISILIGRRNETGEATKIKPPGTNPARCGKRKRVCLARQGVAAPFSPLRDVRSAHLQAHRAREEWMTKTWRANRQMHASERIAGQRR